MPVASRSARGEHVRDRSANRVRKGKVRTFAHPPANKIMYVISAAAQLIFQRARTEKKKRQHAAAIVEAARSLASDTGVASVALAGVADRAGVHYSAVRRYFSSHREVLLHLVAEGWTRWSNTVCAALREPAPMSPSRVAETLANGLAADPLFCDLLANLHLHLEHEVDLDRLSRSGGPAPLPNVARGCDRAGVAGAGALGRTKRPSCGLLIDGLLLADRPPAAEADRRLRRGAAGPA